MFVWFVALTRTVCLHWSFHIPGAKILSMSIHRNRIKFLDTLNFVPMSLANASIHMGLPDVLRKGEFPFKASKIANLYKVWPTHPPPSYYDFQAKSAKAKKAFLTWYKANVRKSFDFQKQMVAYCLQDVKILSGVVCRFRALFMQLTTHPTRAPGGLDPFRTAITLASAVSQVWRQVFLEPETIALLPALGPTPERMHSFKASAWLRYLNVTHKFQPQIQHAQNGGEKMIHIKLPTGSIKKYFVDGFREQIKADGTKVLHVYEFLGDFWFVEL